MPDNAPTYLTLKIPQDKIAEAIGKGGATIRGICDETGADVDIGETGIISIFALTKIAAEKAKGMFEAVTAEAEVGTIYTGKVNKIVDFGALSGISVRAAGITAFICFKMVKRASRACSRAISIISSVIP